MYPSNVRCERSFACYHRSDYHNGPVAQLVRAPPCHGGGRGFEPHPGRLRKRKIKYGILAQLGEHLPYKQRVTGSSPVGPIHAAVAELADAQDLKSCCSDTVPVRFRSAAFIQNT